MQEGAAYLIFVREGGDRADVGDCRRFVLHGEEVVVGAKNFFSIFPKLVNEFRRRDLLGRT